MLTKEECLEALKNIEHGFGCDMAYYGLECERDLLLKLIDEHFTSSSAREETRDNPPLRWEELKEGTCVWVRDMERYMQVIRMFKYEGGGMIFADGYILDFCENRFYRKQVD